MPIKPHFRLDSSIAGQSRWPLFPTNSGIMLRCEADTLVSTLRNGEEIISTWANPLEALQWLGTLGRTYGPGPLRWVGYISYDLGRLFEVLPNRAVDDLGMPLFAFALCRHDDQSQPGNRTPAVAEQQAQHHQRPRLTSTFDAHQYRTAVAKVIDYIRAGDIFQANLAQRFTIQSDLPPAVIYERLLRSAPATYGGLLDFGDFALICNSPELFFRVTPHPDGSRQIITRPIKGTRPKTAGMDIELRDSIKDQAELNMIVDLERNDLGRICQIGSVKVTGPRTIETHPTVYHGVSTIEGMLRSDVGFVDILRAMFPGGSITGAPKIRAMEIIDELEPVCRGPYCGAIGCLNRDGSMEFNIAIRTMIAKAGQIHIPVGGGVVADSDADAEYEETLVKARAMFAALGVSIAEMP